MAAIILSIIAILISVISFFFYRRYSRINILFSLQELMTKKASICNVLREEAIQDTFEFVPEPPVNYEKLVLELSMTIKLLDNSLQKYGFEKERDFLLNQFWLQLDFPLRSFLKDELSENAVSFLRTNFRELLTIFKNYPAA